MSPAILAFVESGADCGLGIWPKEKTAFNGPAYKLPLPSGTSIRSVGTGE
jgi:hypothetical protein